MATAARGPHIVRMSPDERSRDRMGAGGESEARRYKGMGWVIVPFALVVLLLAFRRQLPPAAFAFVILFVAVGSVGALAVLPRFFGEHAGTVMGTALMGANRGTGGDTFSIEDSLIIRGLHAEAAARFDERMAEEQDSVALRLRAAELHAREMNDPARAAQLFREVQSHPQASSADEILASNRLADLYLGPLNEPRRALTELRRITVRHPGTRAAAHALEALRSLKAQMEAEDS
jgi:hypothetical protein